MLFKAIDSHQKHNFLLTFGPITQKLRLKQKKSYRNDTSLIGPQKQKIHKKNCLEDIWIIWILIYKKKTVLGKSL